MSSDGARPPRIPVNGESQEQKDTPDRKATASVIVQFPSSGGVRPLIPVIGESTAQPEEESDPLPATKKVRFDGQKMRDTLDGNVVREPLNLLSLSEAIKGSQGARHTPLLTRSSRGQGEVEKSGQKVNPKANAAAKPGEPTTENDRTSEAAKIGIVSAELRAVLVLDGKRPHGTRSATEADGVTGVKATGSARRNESPANVDPAGKNVRVKRGNRSARLTIVDHHASGAKAVQAL